MPRSPHKKMDLKIWSKPSYARQSLDTLAVPCISRQFYFLNVDSDPIVPMAAI